MRAAHKVQPSASPEVAVINGLDVTERTAADWLAATTGEPRNDVPRSRGEKVVQLTRPVPESWALVDIGVNSAATVHRDFAFLTPAEREMFAPSEAELLARDRSYAIAKQTGALFRFEERDALQAQINEGRSA